MNVVHLGVGASSCQIYEQSDAVQYCTSSLINAQEKTLSLVATGGTCVLGAALVSWGHADGVLRAKLRKEQPPYPAMRPPRSGGPVTTCVSIPDCSQLWLGYSTGKILVYRSV